MSDTRWSACADATKALVEGYNKINTALEEIADDVEEKHEIKAEARDMASYVNQLETGILTALWHDILHHFHGNSQVLQSADQDLNSAVAIYESLIEFIGKLPGSAPEVQQTAAIKFRMGSFLVIIDCLDAELRKRQRWKKCRILGS